MMEFPPRRGKGLHALGIWRLSLLLLTFLSSRDHSGYRFAQRIDDLAEAGQKNGRRVRVNRFSLTPRTFRHV